MKYALVYAGIGITVALAAAIGLYALTFAAFAKDVSKKAITALKRIVNKGNFAA